MRVLVVEDERKLAGIEASALAAEAYEVVVATDGRDGFVRATRGVRCRRARSHVAGPERPRNPSALRQRRIHSPVLILTARDGVEDRVLGLYLGLSDEERLKVGFQIYDALYAYVRQSVE